MGPSIGRVWHATVLSLHVAVWLLVTLWLGAVGIAGAIRFLLDVRKGFATFVRCPRRHRVELYGTYSCPRCRAVRQGHAFDACRSCGARPTHLDCERCGLAVRP